MILTRITLVNFRQFKSRNSIAFATSPKNVTVVFGENGRGKTGLYRAMVFALFGEIRLNQDDDTSADNLRLVNASAMAEAMENETVEARVELDFEHNGEVLSLIRTRLAIKQAGKIYEQEGELKLRIVQRDGNTKNHEDEKSIKEIVGNIVNPRVKDYYLFDGETMDKLTRAGVSQRKEVSKGIRSLLRIDALEIAINAMERVTSNFAKDLSKAASVEYARVLHDVEKCKQEISKYSERIKEIDNEVCLAEEEIQKTDKELESYKEIKDLVLRRGQINESIARREKDRLAASQAISGMFERTAMLLIKLPLANVHEDIEQKRKRGELPAEIRRNLIERVLRQNLCICGRSVMEDTQALQSIESWKDKTSEEAIEDSTLRLWHDLGGICGRQSTNEQDAAGQLQLYGSAMNDIAEYENQLEEISASIGHSERNDASKLESVRSQLDQRRINLLAERKVNESSLAAHKLHLDQLNMKKAEEEAKEAKKDEYTARVALSRQVTDALSFVHDKFTKEIRIKLEDLASSALSNILDSAGQANMCKVRVKDDYSLEVLNKYGDPWLAEISAGQRQVLSIAFIAALAEAASNGKLLEMPLFMDTPFGRLSSKHRENLMRLVPRKSAQWILLATDTEFRNEEAQILEGTGSWGRLYFLQQGEDGNTTIEERTASKTSFEKFRASGGSN